MIVLITISLPAVPFYVEKDLGGFLWINNRSVSRYLRYIYIYIYTVYIYIEICNAINGMLIEISEYWHATMQCGYVHDQINGFLSDISESWHTGTIWCGARVHDNGNFDVKACSLMLWLCIISVLNINPMMIACYIAGFGATVFSILRFCVYL